MIWRCCRAQSAGTSRTSCPPAPCPNSRYLLGVALGTVALFAFYSLVVTTSDVVTWGGLTLIVAVFLGVGAVRCINYAGLAFDRAIRRLN